MDAVNAERREVAESLTRRLAVMRKASGAAPAAAPAIGDAPAGDASGAEHAVSQPGEPAEKEADAVSEQVAGELHGGAAGDKAGADDVKGAAPREAAAPIAAKLLDGAASGAKVMLSPDDKGGDKGGGVKLTGGGQRKIGNLANMKDMTVADAIRARGGGASQVNMAGNMAQKKLGEVANLAAAGDALAETAIKMVKQAASKAGDHSGRSG